MAAEPAPASLRRPEKCPKLPVAARSAAVTLTARFVRQLQVAAAQHA